MNPALHQSSSSFLKPARAEYEMKRAFNSFLPPLQMKLTRLLQLARLSGGQLPRFPAAPLCACQGLNPAPSTSESPHAPVEGPRLYSATAPLYMRAGGRVDASAVAAVLEEADGVSDIRSEDLVVNRTTSPKVRKSCSLLQTCFIAFMGGERSGGRADSSSWFVPFSSDRLACKAANGH